MLGSHASARILEFEMHNGLENGVAEHHINGSSDINGYATPTSQPDSKSASAINDQENLENGEGEQDDNSIDSPPSKRRKITAPDTNKPSTPRHISPPWKKVEVHGPSSFVEQGRRKSSRTNFIPIDLQPQSDKRQTRAAIQHASPVTKSKYGGANVYKSSPLTTASTQAPSNNKRPHSRTSSTHATSKSPVKQSRPVTADQSDGPADPPPPVKRSHKKKLPPQPTSPPPPQTPEPINPHKTRRVGRPPNALSAPRKEEAPTTNGWHKTEGKPLEVGKETPNGPGYRKQRLSLKVRVPTMTVQHPENLVRRRQVCEKEDQRPMFTSFEDWLDREGRFGLEGDGDPRMTDEQAHREACLRTRIAEAAQPGGLLSEEICQIYIPEAFEPPPRLYTVQDRLVAHAVNFHRLMERERTQHLRAAKETAERAAALITAREEQKHREWKKEQPKTEDEIAQEQHEAFKEIYQQLRDDIKKKWLMISEMVEVRRLQRWQEEQERLGKEALNEVIEKSRGLLDKRRAKRSSEADSNDSGDDEEAESNDGSEDPGSSEDEDNMSSSQSESGEEQSARDDDEGLTQEELLRKYEAIQNPDEDRPPDRVQAKQKAVLEESNEATSKPAESAPETRRLSRAQTFNSISAGPDDRDIPLALEEVDDALMDDSDASTDMDDDMGDSDEPSEEGESDEEEDEDEEPRSGGLLGLFSKKELDDLGDKEESSKEDPMSEEETEKVSLIPDATQGPTPSATTSEEPQQQARDDVDPKTQLEVRDRVHPPANIEATKDDEDQKTETQVAPQSANADLRMHDNSLPVTPMSTQPLKTPVPSLLRGTLREYQHFGLDWLAGLYANNNNGILADEMGLGKTIQTIALLAHLAVHHENWGPHLIVVPTSVMINWEVEFKKFLPGFKILTYYGTQEERKKKRQGWLDNDKYNVWITSYTLITQDQQIFKRKKWQYMVLDEAHNIKNFQSLRWQTLLTFRTRARLLLTGTPLQNNLTELWSLLYFLMPADSMETGVAGFSSLEEFSSWFKKPTEQILEQGREALDDDAKVAVTKLHDILRPYLLRRLKADVEKQMPKKYEHVVYCKLSKRQRYLYDGFMSRAQTRETLASGNTFSIMNALMQLRKVCNHPDLFETRQIVTSFAMKKSAVASYEIKEFLVRRRLLQEDSINAPNLNMLNLVPGANEDFSALDTIQRQRLGALGTLRQLTSQQWGRIDFNMQFDGSSVNSTLSFFENNARKSRFEGLCHASYLTSLRSQRRPLYNHSLMEKLRFGIKSLPQPPLPAQKSQLSEWQMQTLPSLSKMVLTLPERAEALETTVQKFACVTPAVVATDMPTLALGPAATSTISSQKHLYPPTPFHSSATRLSIAFPDKRLLQYDCGKLQKLATLLLTLRAGGHRALIFTQMTRVLDLLEQFLNIHGHRYLRLDGATKIEQRQVLTERFNNDPRILAFILSSRSGGIGINLTGADTVIFYDLDWNPAMDKQCQDRCHRIGQTRDVHIYRLVSEHTIEANILRKANQKRLLDDVVIQDGAFTTDSFNNTISVNDLVGADPDPDALGETNPVANAAVDRVLGSTHAPGRVFEAVEDAEDVVAAKGAEKEVQEEHALDFDEGATRSPKTPATPREPIPPLPVPVEMGAGGVEVSTSLEAEVSGLVVRGADGDGEEVRGSCDDAMVRVLEWEFRDAPVNAGRERKGVLFDVRG